MRLIAGAAPLDTASEGDLSFLDNPKYVKHLATTRAAACLCQKRYADRVPEHVAVLETAEPYRAYSLYLARAYPAALRPIGFLRDGSGAAALCIPMRGWRTGCAWSPGRLSARAPRSAAAQSSRPAPSSARR